MKNKLYISIGILTVLIIFYIININQQKNYQSTSNKIFNFDQEQVNSLLIKSEGASIEIQRVDTSWVIVNNDSLTLKNNVLTTFFDKIFKLESETIMTTNENKWSTYNVDDSLGTHLALVDYNDYTIGYYVFGRSNSDYARCYVRTKESSDVHLVNQNVMYNLQANPQYWGESVKGELLEVPEVQ